MTDLPENLFADPVWHALHTAQRRFATCAGDACRYPADVAPFAAVAAPGTSAFRELHSLLDRGESIWLFGASCPQLPELEHAESLRCLQMVLPADVTLPDPGFEPLRLSAADAPDMIALTELAFPGFFRDRTYEMGRYYGIRANGALVAMGGERLILEEYVEISGVCTHPRYRGHGYAASLMWQLARDHRRDGLVSWLHVGASNPGAIALYVRLGFKVVREVTLHRLARRE